MRDQKDPGTLDLLPPKRGRPCLDSESGPMTPAEKQRRYRQLRSARAGRIATQAPRVLDVSHDDYLETTLALTDAVLLDAIRDEASFLSGLLSKGSARGSAPAKKRIGALVAELARRYPEK